jgi:hypothetical protein
MSKKPQNALQQVLKTCFESFCLLLIVWSMIGIGEYWISTWLKDANKADFVGCSMQPVEQDSLSETRVRRLRHPDDRVDAFREEIDLSYWMKKRVTPFQPIILEAAERYDIDAAMIKAVIMAESSFNPKAVSKKGARGLMQLMPSTAEYLGVEDSFDPAHNIDGGVRYLKTLLVQFQYDIKLALAAYNAGSRNVRMYGGVPPFKATQSYVHKVLKYYEGFKTV